MRICQWMCEELEISNEELISFYLQAPKMYKVYAIPKRNSGKRIIAHPAKKVKKYQELLIQKMKTTLFIHERAFAYKKGSSIKKNAQEHQHSKYLLKMDFNNFFNSITSSLFSKHLLESNVNFTKEDISLMDNLAFWCPSKETGGLRILSVGAPSSPFISNWIMSKFDEAINILCIEKDVIYTRYADDLTFSTKHKGLLFDFPKIVKAILFSTFGDSISINDSKTVFSSKRHNRHVTGVTITNNEKLSVGRERKRYISMLVHKFSINELSNEDVDHLCGILSFANFIEPGFLFKMKKKYSEDVINELLSLQGSYKYD